ncbi:hypothetical protein BHE97_03985 [Aeromicrobium sp. PE09-221]|uniref:ABC transporter substrate-binding protein n=1 Tax=Aeromicrobium sp. PE09-221 TaxID=1898043 RepID=UPI000B3E61A8|nr:ABC transporter substrate-binding protein [Aeromicrobium sp. PE09-221]OUZ11676.1 hypothetical protein BHE97_03985 [Aeromicrobium sp. PE09-221]
MRRSMKAVGIGVTLALLAGCGGTEGGGESDAERVDGGEVSIALPTTESFDMNSLDPNVGGNRIYAHTISMTMFDQLVSQEPESGEIMPWIAESWDVSDDGLEYTFQLRDDVTFWDGEPLTAEDVAFTFERVVDPQYMPESAFAAASMSAFESAEAVDDHTVVVRLEQPQAAFLANVARNFLSIVPKHYVEEVGDEGFAEEPMGSGPFTFVEWQRDGHLTVERNPDYAWGPPFTETAGSAPSVERLTFTYVPEDSTRTAALQSGQVNAIMGVPPLSQESFEGNDQFEVVEIQKNGQPGGLTFDTSSPGPAGEVEVRQAISLAIDREALNSAVYDSKHEPAYFLLEERMGDWVNEEARFPDFDPDAAAEVLDEAGWQEGPGGIRSKDGVELSLDATTSTQMQRTMTLIQSQLKDIGIELNVDVVSPAEASAVIQGEDNYDLAWGNPIGWTNGMPDLLYSLYHSRFIPPNGTSNETRTSIPEVDSLLESAVQSLDDEQRREDFDQVQSIVGDYVSYLPLLSFNANIAVASGVHGIMPERRGTYVYFHDVWVSENLQQSWPGN